MVAILENLENLPSQKFMLILPQNKEAAITDSLYCGTSWLSGKTIV
jgi:hypothetical protein